ncbi:hypothetical protein ACS0TY_035288 [Phlomoides rotata]
MDFTFAKLSLLEDEGDELLLEPDIDPNVEPIVEFSVVGRFLTDQAISFAIMKSRLISAWKPKKGVSIKEIGSGRYLFQFYHPLDVKRVIDGSPWAFGNHPLVMHQLQTSELPLTVPLNHLAFWVQLYGHHVGYFSENVGRSLGNLLASFWTMISRMRMRFGGNICEFEDQIGYMCGYSGFFQI